MPVGAVVVIDGEIVAARHNERQVSHDPTAHAEILALRDTAHQLGTWHLENAALVVTLEPCVMCAGAAVSSRLGALYFGASDPKAGATGSLFDICSDPRLNHRLPVVGGVQAERSATLLKAFFAAARRDRKGR